MSKSPGHRQWPDHQVREEHLAGRVEVIVDCERIAHSRDVVEVQEDGSPRRFYFPRSDVRMEAMERSSTTSECPFKGTAHYFSFTAAGNRYEDAAWSYEDPYDEHAELKERIAFYEEKVPGIEIKVAA